jgi:hypothetical protein
MKPINDYERYSRPHRLKSELLRLSLFLLVLPVLLYPQAAQRATSRRLLVISIGGLDSRLLNEPVARLKIPNIRKLMRQGAMASGVVGVAPSDPWPSHTSLITGAPPAEQNSTPLWEAAMKNGLITGAVYWPETAGASIAFNFPAMPEERPGHDVQFGDIAKRSSPAGIADRIEKASPGFEKQLWDDNSSAQAAIYLLTTEKPDLMLVQFAGLDFEQRETGALSVYAREALETDDELIGQLFSKAPAPTIMALVSGHVFENENYIVRPRVLLKSGVEVTDGLIGATDRATAERLRKLMTDGHRHGIAREVPMSEVRARVPSLGHWAAAFDTPPNYVASPEDHGPALGPGTHLGVTGLWPTRPGYRSVFVIAGEGIQPRKLGEIDLLQIAPTLADALGVKLPQAKKMSLWTAIAR